MNTDTPMKTPDFTPQAIAAFVMVVGTNLLVLFNFNITDTKKAALESLVNGVAVVGFLVHDFVVRKARAGVVAAQISSSSGASTTVVNNPPVTTVTTPDAQTALTDAAPGSGIT